MAAFKCLPLSRLSGINRGSEIVAEEVGDFFDIQWKNSHLMFPNKLLADIQINFFRTSKCRTLGELGDYMQNHQEVWGSHSPRFSSMISAIMVHKKMIAFRKTGRTFELRKL